MNRTFEQWQKSDPKAMAKMSEAAIMYALADARSDVLWMHAEIARINNKWSDLLASALKVNALSIQTEAHKELRAAIAAAQSNGQPEEKPENETTIPAIVFYPAGSLGEEVA